MDKELYITLETKENLEELQRALLDEDGKEWFNPAPRVINTGIGRPLTLHEQIKRVFHQLSAEVHQQGVETIEESDDFMILSDFEVPEMDSKYEIMEDEVTGKVVPDEEESEVDDAGEVDGPGPAHGDDNQGLGESKEIT